MRLLLNDVAPGLEGPVVDDETLARLYAYPDDAAPGDGRADAAPGDGRADAAPGDDRDDAAPGDGGRWLRANMVSTLDGAATGPDGRTGSINNEADKAVFGLLRALADVVVVGAGTVRAEGYRHPRPVPARRAALREGRPAAPTLVVVSRSASLPPQLLAAPPPDGSGEVLLATSAAAGGPAVDAARDALGEDRVLVLGDDGVDLPALLDHLAGRGMRRVLTEGGPHLLRDLAAAGLLDELCLTVVPELLGGPHPRILEGAELARSLRPRLLLEADGTLLGRWTRHS